MEENLPLMNSSSSKEERREILIGLLAKRRPHGFLLLWLEELGENEWKCHGDSREH